MGKLIQKIKKNVLIKRTTTILFIIALIALFIILTLWINSLNIDPIDFTATKLYTLTDTSKEQLKDIQKEVNMYFIGYSENDTIIDLVNQYENVNKNIKIEIITDTTSRPDLVQKYEIDTSTSGIIVESGDKYKVLTSYDFYTYDPATYEQIDITEEKLTNSILYVVADKIPTVYFLEGYSEFSVSQNMNYLTVYLENEVTEYDTLNIITTGKIPEKCDTLIIPSPSKDFDDVATQAIIEYINNGGNILWFNMVVAEKNEFTNVNKILAMYGVKPFEVGVIKETDSNKMMSGLSNVILPEVQYTDITKNIPNVLLVNATKINFVSDEELVNLNVTKTDILQASESSFFRTDLTIQEDEKQNKDEEGPFVVGAELQKQITEDKVSKLVIYGENVFVSDYTITSNSQYPVIMYLYNKNIAIDSMSYLVDRSQDIVIRKDTNTVTYTATEQQDNIIQAVIYGLPIIIILAGILVWQHRRRKK